ncbi:hypothetical protein SAY87_028036 [Trapa incisa]|uniref:non-specific serine/threonine protein kinase n=1 Tax=Trapa incisa TaxID=236973 RepID=A0AAN7L1V8_9MYRT|nr:hypothetical protein SAY87_028036 [Trapa incisa]
MSCHHKVGVFHHLHSWRRKKRIAWPLNLVTLFLALLCSVFFIEPSLSLHNDGMVLLSFKHSIVGDPLGVLSNWNDGDQTPCSWRGVTCGDHGNFTTYYRVVGLSLPNSQLSGSIPSNTGAILFLRTLDLSNNFLSGSLPPTFLAAAELRFLDLSNNRFTGQILETVGQLTNLQLINLSANGLSGGIPKNLTVLQNLTIVCLRGNHLTGGVPSGLTTVRVLDLSSNYISGLLPPDFGGESLNYLNFSYNNLSGEIPADFSSRIPGNATLDLSYNNLTGEIPKSVTFLNQEPRSFSGNPGLCGVPTRNPCPIPSFPSLFPNVSAPLTSPPAFAAIPKMVASSPEDGGKADSEIRGGHSGLRPRAIVGIVIGDVAVIGILGAVFTFVYRWRKRSNLEAVAEKMKESKSTAAPAINSWSSSFTSSESRGIMRWSCLRKARNEEASSDTTASDASDDVNHGSSSMDINKRHTGSTSEPYKQGTLVTVDAGEGGGGGGELELDTLLKASAYILGASGSRIMYKAVLEDGTSLAVRRIGESGFERLKDFEGQVRAIAKLVHPNLVRVRGFYWGTEEKLIIYDFVPNGSLANARYRKVASSPGHLPWEARLKIAKGVARGLTYLHEKKHVHGNLKPSNILLGSDMEPKIGDFGLEQLVIGDTSYKAGGSARIFGSKRSTASKDGFQEASLRPSPSPSPSPSCIGGISPYHAPESLRTLKPSPKWDVYSFGVILLELLSGKIMAVDELGQVNGLVVDDHQYHQAMRMADIAIRADLEGKEEALIALLKLGLSCASPIPQKRPPIKEALLVLEKIPCYSPPSSLSSYYYY